MLDKIFKYFSENRLLVNLIIVLILFVGIFATLRMQQEVMPPTDMDTMIVTVIYPGASPVDVEVNAVIPMEQDLKSVMGIKETISLSMENMARIYIYLDEEAVNKRAVKDEIIRTVQNIAELPDDIEDISIRDINPKLMKVYSLGLHAEKGAKISKKTLYKWADKIEDGLARLSDVAQVNKEGYVDPEIKIYVNPKKMQKYYISLNDIANSIQKRNIRSTGGTIQSVSEEKTIVTIGQFDNPMDVKDVIIRSSFEQQRVRINDIAKVKSGYRKENVLVKIDREPGVVISVTKKENSDITRTIDNVKEYIEKIEKQFPEGLKIITVDDRSRSIKALLNVVKSNAFVGFILVFVILMLFLDFRSAFWTAVGIPLTILMVMTYMYVEGISLNTISLGAIITVLGMLVDHGIVISENIYMYRSEGMPPLKAVIKGLKEVLAPVVITILTTIVAFLPLLAVGGKMGKFISIYPIIITVALAASFFEAVFLLPNHLAHGKVKKKSKKKAHWFTAVSNWYEKALIKVLKFRYIILSVFLVLFIVTIFMAKNSFNKFVLFPSSSADTLLINVEAPEGTPLAKTEKYLKKIENLVLTTVNSNELIAIKTIVGHHREKLWNDQGQRENWGQVTIYLVPSTERERTANILIRTMKKKLAKKPIKEFDKILFSKFVMGPDPGKGVDIKLVGNNEKNMQLALADIVGFVTNIDGVSGIDHTLKPGKTELKINFNYEKLAQLNMDVATVAQTVRMAYEGMVVTSIQTIDKELDFRVAIAPGYQKNKKFLLELLIPNKQGRLIPLKQVATITERAGSSTIYHYNGDKSVTITASIDKNISTSKQVMQKVMKKYKGISKKYPGIRFQTGGEAKETQESMSDLLSAFVLALLGIYLILAILFKNPGQPILVLIVVPFGMIGALLAFMGHGIPLSFMGMVGMIGLSGVVVNDSVVMVSFINTVMKDNPSTKSADLVANIASGAKRRLRPVILTTLTTVGGLLPTVYGIGGTSESIVPVVMALSYGLLFATFLTLLFIPALYLIGLDMKNIGPKMKEFLNRKKGLEKV